ncbi:hypothetical protein NEDG_00453 [Nematocida displodere]|uniref:Telomerase reverse transcriptase n=1 Tax=Nematocida displodere TaxID=1805483 RepID=A0A177EJD2_9MICR|nr:hypothetical protein NEDG_00453 [Nematocida displodere]
MSPAEKRLRQLLLPLGSILPSAAATIDGVESFYVLQYAAHPKAIELAETRARYVPYKINCDLAEQYIRDMARSWRDPKHVPIPKFNNANIFLRYLRGAPWREVFSLVGEVGIMNIFKQYIVVALGGAFKPASFQRSPLLFLNGDLYRIYLDLKVCKAPGVRKTLRGRRIDRDSIGTVAVSDLFRDPEHIPDDLSQYHEFLANIHTADVEKIFKRTVRYMRKKEGDGVRKIEVDCRYVIKYLMGVIKQVFPGLFSKKNLQVLKDKLVRIINTNDDVYLSDTLNGFSGKVGQNSRESPHQKQQILHGVVKFICGTYMHYLIRRCTIMHKTREESRFFQRGKFCRMRRDYVTAHLSKYFVEAESRPETHSTLMVIAKTDSFRIVFEKAVGKGGGPAKRLVGDLNKECVCVLTHEAKARAKKAGRAFFSTNPADLAFSLLKKTDGLKIVNNFKRLHQPRFQANEDLYILQLDFAKCFDNIQHSALKKLRIPESLFEKRHYELFLATTLGDRNTYQKLVLSPDSSTNSKVHTANTVYTDDLIESMRQGIFNNHVAYKGKYYRQVRGIPQGYPASNHLCSYFLARLDKTIYTQREDTAVIRYIDDTLVLSWSLEEIERIIQRIETTQEETGIIINYAKSKLVRHREVAPAPAPTPSNQITLQARDQIEWCGILFCTQTLETLVSYKRGKGRERGNIDAITQELKDIIQANIRKGTHSRSNIYRKRNKEALRKAIFSRVNEWSRYKLPQRNTILSVSKRLLLHPRMKRKPTSGTTPTPFA